MNFLGLEENLMDQPHVHPIFTKVRRSFFHSGQSLFVPDRIFMIRELYFFRFQDAPERRSGCAAGQLQDEQPFFGSSIGQRLELFSN